jgi:hypothetical protein
MCHTVRLWSCSVFLLALRQPISFKAIWNLGFAPSSTDRRAAPPLLRGKRRGLPGPAGTPALMARLAMWKAGDYLLPLPTFEVACSGNQGQ